MAANRNTAIEDGLRAALDGPERIDEKTEFMIYQALMRDNTNRGHLFLDQSRSRIKDGTWGYVELYNCATFSRLTEDIDTFFDMLMDVEVGGNGEAIQVVLFSCLESCEEWGSKASGHIEKRTLDLMMKCMEPENAHIDITQLLDFFGDRGGVADRWLLEYLWDHMENADPHRAFSFLFGLCQFKSTWMRCDIVERMESVTSEYIMSVVIDVLSDSQFLASEWVDFLARCLKARVSTKVLSKCINRLRTGSDELRELMFERVLEINDKGRIDDEDELGNLYSAAGSLGYSEILEHGLIYFPGYMSNNIRWRWVRATSYVVSRE